MPGIFEVYEDKSRKYRFRLKAANGEIVAAGEAYETKAAAKRGCESVQKACDGARIVDVTEVGAGVVMSGGDTEQPRPPAALHVDGPPTHAYMRGAGFEWDPECDHEGQGGAWVRTAERREAVAVFGLRVGDVDIVYGVRDSAVGVD